MIVGTVVKPENEPPRKPSLWGAAFSWACCFAAAAVAGGLAVFIAVDRERYRDVFKKFGVNLSSTAKLFYADHPTMTIVVAVVIAFALGVQLLYRRRPDIAVTGHLALLVACLGIFAAYSQAMAGAVLGLFLELHAPR
jgi:hypothetical protein